MCIRDSPGTGIAALGQGGEMIIWLYTRDVYKRQGQVDLLLFYYGGK